MNNFQEFALADWGTSNLRVWIANDQKGVEKKFTSPHGAGRLSSDQFYGNLKDILLEAGIKLSAARRFPVIICGMAGSRTGWAEASYVPVPASCSQILKAPVSIQTDDLDVYILPGLAQQNMETPDVMRGEETQLLGLCVQRPDFSGLVCLPGTHSKWAVLEHGHVSSFHTAMTGELFALLSKQSVLAHVIGADDFFEPADQAFKDGVLAGYHHPERIIFDLFSIRARGLLFSASGAQAAARLSGMLIGAEISVSMRGAGKGQGCALVATGRLLHLYQQAFDSLDYVVERFDADELVQTGLNFAAQQIGRTAGQA